MMSIIIYTFCSAILLGTTLGFTVDQTPIGSSFASLLDFSKHHLGPGGGGDGRNLTEWEGAAAAAPSGSKSHSHSRLGEEHQLLLGRTPHLQASITQENVPLLMSGKRIEDIVKYHNAQVDTALNIQFPDDSDFSSSVWSKRQAEGGGDKAEEDATTTSPEEQIATLEPDLGCVKKIKLCGLLPLKSMECLTHCYLNTKAVPSPKLKFLHTLMRVFISYANELCPTFGTIYDKIQTEIVHRSHKHNSLKGFLEAADVDITLKSPHVEDFIKHAPSTLFNNLVKYGAGPDFHTVRPILSIASNWINVELAQMEEFPNEYANPQYHKMPQQQWLMTMIDAMAHHPLNVDIFLKGFYVMTRAMSQSLPYPLDSLFVATVFALKLMVGVECSIVSYAQQGVNFQCLQPAPIDAILEDYTKTEEEDKNPLNWMVCGAHQVEIPEWTKAREEYRANKKNKESGETGKEAGSKEKDGDDDDSKEGKVGSSKEEMKEKMKEKITLAPRMENVPYPDEMGPDWERVE